MKENMYESDTSKSLSEVDSEFDQVHLNREDINKLKKVIELGKKAAVILANYYGKNFDQSKMVVNDNVELVKVSHSDFKQLKLKWLESPQSILDRTVVTNSIKVAIKRLAELRKESLTQCIKIGEEAQQIFNKIEMRIETGQWLFSPVVLDLLCRIIKKGEYARQACQEVVKQNNNLCAMS